MANLFMILQTNFYQYRPSFVEAITTSDGNNLPWVNEIRYLGIFIVSFVSFRCSTDHAKRSFFYRAANAIFAKIGRSASEEVILLKLIL